MKEIKKYQKFLGFERPEEMLNGNAENDVLNYLLSMQEKGLSFGSRKFALAVVKHWFEINDYVLNFKKISRFLGDRGQTVEDRPYTSDEIKMLLLKCDERKRVIILTLASMGVRLGGLVRLKMRNLKRVGDIYQITVYEGGKERYTTFCTPECANSIDSYLDFRKRFREIITPVSLVRDSFDKSAKITVAKHLTPNTVQVMMFHLLTDTGIRSKIMMTHGLRKWFSTELNRATDKPMVCELLLAHDLGLLAVYNKTSDEDKLAVYVSGMSALIINDAERLKLQLKEAQSKISKEDELKQEIFRMNETERAFDKQMVERIYDLERQIEKLTGNSNLTGQLIGSTP